MSYHVICGDNNTQPVLITGPPQPCHIIKIINSTEAIWTYPPYRTAVRASTTIAGNLATDYEPGDIIDGVVLAQSDRILIKDQGNVQNGIYIVQASGIPLRADDFNSGGAVAGVYFVVMEGIVNGDNIMLVTTNPPVDVVDVDTINFALIHPSGGGGVTTYTRTVVNAPTYAIATGDDIISVIHTPTAPVTLTLPLITTVAVERFVIVDEGGNASINNITINTSGADNIVGVPTFTINGDYNSIRIYHDSVSNWYIG